MQYQKGYGYVAAEINSIIIFLSTSSPSGIVLLQLHTTGLSNYRYVDLFSWLHYTLGKVWAQTKYNIVIIWNLVLWDTYLHFFTKQIPSWSHWRWPKGQFHIWLSFLGVIQIRNWLPGILDTWESNKNTWVTKILQTQIIYIFVVIITISISVVLRAVVKAWRFTKTIQQLPCVQDDSPDDIKELWLPSPKHQGVATLHGVLDTE